MANSPLVAEKDLRIVLVGKTGVGKSASGNTILGKTAFESEVSLSSVTSVCEKETNCLAGFNLAVIDTPGLFETGKSNEEVVKEIARCISMAAPGPHVFLIVLQPTRFTAEEEKAVEIINTMFGQKAAKYTMILFTHGDVLRREHKTMEDLLEISKPLKQIISQCSILETFKDKYHVFNNKVKDPDQVRELLQKIQQMVQRNGGNFYTNEMFKDAQKAKQEEMEQLLRENPDINPQDARRQAERENSFIRAALKAAGVAATGAATGASIGGAIGGVLKITAAGAAVGVSGGAVGAAVGCSAGALIGAALAVKANGGCVIQ